MSARKIGSVAALEDQVTVEARQASLTLPPEAVSLHRGGIEFRSQKPFPRWVEMTVSIQSPHDDAKVNCTGVVVDCTGNKHAGYHVSMVFTSLSRVAESRLNSILYSRML
ncbi:MAG TPA: PilZ domain-containing protein [Verrucomicrobiae bacterium]|nr:PilZ domain-containing protein [Verrucomicrobiae bacterium]